MNTINKPTTTSEPNLITKEQEVVQAATNAAIEILQIPVLNDYMIPDMAEIIGRYIAKMLTAEREQYSRDMAEAHCVISAKNEELDHLEIALSAAEEKYQAFEQYALKISEEADHKIQQLERAQLDRNPRYQPPPERRP